MKNKIRDIFTKYLILITTPPINEGKVVILKGILEELYESYINNEECDIFADIIETLYEFDFETRDTLVKVFKIKELLNIEEI